MSYALFPFLARDAAQLTCWANRWGDLSKHRNRAKPAVLPEAWQKGYEQAISDVMKHLINIAPDWLDTWQREEWGFHKEGEHGVGF